LHHRQRDVRATEKPRAALLHHLAAIYIPHFIVVMCEPCIIAISHPRVPSPLVRRHRFTGTPGLPWAMNVAQRSIAQTL
jgi:hypothetical protein